MRLNRFILGLAVFCVLIVHDTSWCDLRQELSSHAQQQRDVAAAQLRVSYSPPDPKRWNPVLAKIKKMKTREEVNKFIEPLGAELQGGIGSGGTGSEMYRLDDISMLTIYYRVPGFSMIDAKLSEKIKSVWVKPPENYTGEWVTYFVNGEVNQRSEYKNGTLHGKTLQFHSNGKRSVVQNYREHGIDGESVSYYPTGELSSRSFYKEGKPVGTWVWYKKDGSIDKLDRQEKINPWFKSK